MSSVSLKTFLHPRHWYAWPVLTLMVGLSWMPRRVLWLLGSALGWLYYWFPSPACRIAARNIELCFSELDPGERRRLIQCHFRLCGFAVLCLSVVYWAPAWRVRRFVAVRDGHHLDKVYAGGKNVILLAPHFIGLDFGGLRMSMDRKFVSMYRKSRDPLLEYLFHRRGRFGAVVVERSASLKPIIRSIREGRPFYYLPDQDMGEKSSIFAPFFGIPAATVTALSRIAQSTNAAVVPCITRLLPHGKGIEVQLYPALENFPTDDPAADAVRMNAEIEKWVREMPEQYMWSYRRFKTRPNNEPSLYSK
jgi:KDO2-lipid IV(A) lauroyltransferase